MTIHKDINMGGPRVYIAGPYEKGDQIQNVAKALEVAEIVIAKGGIPHIPHLYHFWHFKHPHEKFFWLALDFEWLKVCKFIVLLENYETSQGSILEVGWTAQLEITIVSEQVLRDGTFDLFR